MTTSPAPAPVVPPTTAEVPVTTVPLPLRHNDPVTLGLAFNVILTTAVLLALTYAALRWYAKRKPMGLTGKDAPALQCDAALRLSARTKVYLVTTPSAQVLVTESTSGVHSVVLKEAPRSSTAPAVATVPTDVERK